MKKLIVSGIILTVLGVYVLYIDRWYSFSGLILILAGVLVALYGSQEEGRKNKDPVKTVEIHENSKSGNASVIKSSNHREKITIDPGDMKTTVTIPAGLRTYLEKYKKDNETYGEELVRLLNED